MRLDDLDKSLDSLIDKSMEQCISDQDYEKFINAMPDIIEGSVNGLADNAYQYLIEISRSMLHDERALEKGFERRHYRLWKKGLDLLEMYIRRIRVSSGYPLYIVVGRV